MEMKKWETRKLGFAVFFVIIEAFTKQRGCAYKIFLFTNLFLRLPTWLIN